MRLVKSNAERERRIMRAPVVSSVIRSVGYDGDHAVLEVEFISGQVYRYHFVPRRTWNELMLAESKGRYFDAHIREKFPTARLP
jgi:hypothetical protein